MNSKTLSIYAAIMAVALVAGIASTTVGTVYAATELKNEMGIKDCTKDTEAGNGSASPINAFVCANAAFNFALGDVNVDVNLGP